MGQVYSSYSRLFSEEGYCRTFEISTQTKILTKQSALTQTYTEKQDASSQTCTKFSEKLLYFSSKTVGSESCFDKVCNICHLGQKEEEAVGYCVICKQYMCLSCCRQHERIASTISHVIIGKDEFDTIIKTKELFDRRIVPYKSGSLSKLCLITCAYNTYHHKQIIGLAYLEEKDSPYILLKYSKIGLCNCDSYVRLEEVTWDGRTKLSSLTGRCVWDICCSKQQKKTYISNTEGRNVYSLTSENKLSSSFNTQGMCYGIAPFDGGLALSIKLTTVHDIPEWQVQYLTYSGDLKRQIYYDSKGSPLFKSPFFLASNTKEDILFVSDESENAVISLNTEGEVLFKYQYEALLRPMGLTVDDENNVYVACGKNVVQVQSDRRLYRTLLSNKSTQNCEFKNVCFNSRNKTLTVTDDGNSITVFNFLP